MSDQRSSSGDDFSRFDPLPNSMGGTDVGDVGDTSASLGSGRSGAGGPANSSRSADRTSNPANFSGDQTGSTSTPGAGTMDKAKDTMNKARDAMGDVQQKATEMTDQAGQKADVTKDKAASGLDSLAGTLRDRGQSMGDGQMGQMATMAADRLEQGAEMLRSKDTDQLVMELEDVIRRRPVESLLVAAAAGYLLSRAL